MPKQEFTSKEVNDNLLEMGYSLKSTFDKTADVRVALAAIKAFDVSIKLQKVQVDYKKLTGLPSKIDFLE